MEKKISFGFNKKAKQPSIVSHKPKKEENAVEFIDCLEGQSIKIKNSIVEEEKAPLEIPLKENARGVLDRIKEFRDRQNELKQEDKTDVTEKLESKLTLDELAAEALIKDAENREKGKSENSEQVHELPQSDKKLVLEGAEEPTLDDYEKVPFTDYGRAMLRGMGWKDGMGLGKNPKIVKEFEPKARLKGLGLGAHKMIANKPRENVNNKGKELLLEPKAFAKIITGRHRGQYCQVQSMDDENSLVIVKTAIKGEILKLNEVFVVPVTKDEYNKFSRVLNNEKYEEYKEISEKNLEKQRHDRRKKDNEKIADDGDPSSSNAHYNDDRRTNHKSDFNTSTDSEDNTDSSNERRSKKHRRRVQNKSKANNHSSSSESDSSEYRRRQQFPRRQRHRPTDKSSSSSSSSPDKRRRDRSSRHRSRSSSNESGYEHHKRRRYKTKCRHRRYSDDESEKTYKKNRKSKR